MAFWSKLFAGQEDIVAASQSGVQKAVIGQGKDPHISTQISPILGEGADRKVVLASVSSQIQSSRDFSAYRDALSYGTLIKGKLSFEGSVRIDGKLDGEVVCTDNVLIGERAEINAKLSANNLVIQGLVRGSIRARGKVELLAGAIVEGQILSPCLVVEPGARINSDCQVK